MHQTGYYNSLSCYEMHRTTGTFSFLCYLCLPCRVVQGILFKCKITAFLEDSLIILTPNKWLIYQQYKLLIHSTSLTHLQRHYLLHGGGVVKIF